MAHKKKIVAGIKKRLKNEIMKSEIIKKKFDDWHCVGRKPSLRHEVDKLVDAIFDSGGNSENQNINQFVQSIENTISSVYLNSDQRSHFFNEEVYLDIPGVDLFVNEVKKLAENKIQFGNKFEINMNDFDNITMLYDQEKMCNYIKERYKYIDAREQEDYAQVRRLDSLARLLTLHSRLSVCASVALHENYLYIGLNASSQDVREEIAFSIANRINLLNEYLNKIRQISEDEFCKREDEMANSLCKLLSECGGLGFPKKVILQAINKLTYAVVYDDSIFGQQEKNAFGSNLLNYNLLIPSLSIPNGQPAMLALTHEKITGGLINVQQKEEKSVYNFTDEPDQVAILSAKKCRTVSDLHAEQLIAYYIFVHKKSKQYNANNKLNMGVSKLCCKTCYANLGKLNVVRVRGLHGVLYEMTANLIDTSISIRHLSTPVKGPTDAIDSPPGTAKKRHIAGDGCEVENLSETNNGVNKGRDLSNINGESRLFKAQRVLTYDDPVEEASQEKAQSESGLGNDPSKH